MAAKATIADYEFICKLGRGAFAEVFLMKEKSTGLSFAIKKVSKSLLKREGKIEQAIRERELLSSLNHEGIVKLHKAFHDPSYLYLVMEYCSKESLGKLLERHGRMFPLSLVRYYSAELVVMLDVLRRSNIIHRDIKPENILITQTNHLKLIDFNCAKKLSSRKTMKNTFVGTLSYVAPEVIKNSTVIGPEIDLWSLGCLIYQMLTGRLPFHATSQEEIYENILNGRYTLSPEVNPDAASLVRALLKIEPELRIGYNSIDEIKAHSFFDGMNFETLWSDQVPDVIEEIKQEEEKKNEEIEHLVRREEEKKDEQIKVVFEGTVTTKNIFRNRSRRLVLTNEPSIKLYSLKDQKEREVVKVKSILAVKVPKNNLFIIETTKKNYEFTADNPNTWAQAIRTTLNL